MYNMKKALSSIIISLLLALAFSCMAACTQDVYDTGPQKSSETFWSVNNDSDNESITLIMKYMTRDYRDEIISGAKTAANEYGADLTIQSLLPSDAPSKQAEMMYNAIELGADAVILIAEKTDELETEISKQQSVPVVLIDTGWAKDKAVCSIETDDRQMASDIINQLNKSADPGCTVYILNSVCPAGETNDRKELLLSELENTDFQEETIDYNTESQTELKRVIESKLNEDLGQKAVVALDGFSSSNAILAIKEQKQEVPLIAFGSTLDLVSEMENGKVTAMVVENAFTKGYIAVQNAAEAVKKGAKPEDILLKARVVTPVNLYLPENQKLIFPLT